MKIKSFAHYGARLWIFSGLAVLWLCLVSMPSQAQCYNSYAGGDGDTWLSGTITASGLGAADIQVCLQPSTWQNGKIYTYECACTDENGAYSFERETDPANNCYTSYSWGDTETRYCNWRSAECYKQCVDDDLYNWYVGYEFAAEGYSLYATPPWGSEAALRYGNCQIDDITIDFDNPQTADCTLDAKNNILQISVTDQIGNPVTNGLTIYASGKSYAYQNIDDASTSLYVSDGTYYIGAYCSNWQDCDFGCISNKSITVSGENQTIEVALIAKSNNSIITGSVLGSDGASIANASVSIGSTDNSGSADGCYAYGWATTDSAGNYSISVPEGKYTAWINPPWEMNGASYGSAQAAIALTATEPLEQNFTLQKKDANFSGTVSKSTGDVIAGASVNGWTVSSTSYDWIWAQSNDSGAFSAHAMNGIKYNVSAYYWDGSNKLAPCPREGMQTVKAPNTDLTFTFDVWDHTLNLAFVDEDGNAITDAAGGASIRLASADAEGFWCGTWADMSDASGTQFVGAGLDYTIEPYTWTGNYDPQSSQIEFTAGESGATTQQNIVLIPVDATISGNFVDENGNAITIDSDYFWVFANRGFLWKNCTVSSSSYSCAVSAGTWNIGSWQDQSLGYSAMPLGADGSKVTVTAGAQVTQNLTFLQNGSIAVSVVAGADTSLAAKAASSENVPMQWVWVEANPVSNADQGDNGDNLFFFGNGCLTDENGECTINAAAASTGTTYYLHAFRPWQELFNEDLTLPAEVAVTVTGGQSTTADSLVFKRLDGELNVTTSMNSDAQLDVSKGFARARTNPVLNSSKALSEEIVDSVYISCFSSEGAYAEANADESGLATVQCVSGETWECFGIQMLGNDLYISEAAEATCASTEAGGTDVNIALNFAAAVPDAVTQNWDAGSSGTLNLSDGYSVTFPAGALGDGTVSCNVQPDPILPYQAGKRPSCFYGYDLTCSDSNGNAITQLSSEATMCIPLCGEQLELLKLNADDLSLTYRDPSTDSYINLTNVTVDNDNAIVCGKTNHLTEFVLVGNGDIAASDGDAENAGEEAERTGEEGSGAANGSSSCGCVIQAPANHIDLGALTLSLLGLLTLRMITRKDH